MTGMDERDLLRQAERLLHSATVDALAEMVVVLTLIAEGKVDPGAAGVAADQLRALLEAAAAVEHVAAAVQDRRERPSSVLRVVH